MFHQGTAGCNVWAITVTKAQSSDVFTIRKTNIIVPSTFILQILALIITEVEQWRLENDVCRRLLYNEQDGLHCFEHLTLTHYSMCRSAYF